MRKRIHTKLTPALLHQTHGRRGCVPPTWEQLLLPSDRAAVVGPDPPRKGKPERIQSKFPKGNTQAIRTGHTCETALLKSRALGLGLSPRVDV